MLLISELKYTAFEANGKQYEFTRIPIGIKNGVAAFQQTMCQFVSDENLKDVFVQLIVLLLLAVIKQSMIVIL